MTQIGGVGGASNVGGVSGGSFGQEVGAVRIPFGKSGQASFADTLKTALGEVSELQSGAQDAIGSFLRGEPIEIHEVMAAAEEAGIALDMLIEFRNKLTEAYRSVMQMQQ